MKKDKKKTEPKDMISVGIFTAVYFSLMFACGMLGYIPVLYILLPAVIPFVCGIPFMLFLTKVKRFGMVSVMGTVCGGLMMLTGHTFVPLISGAVCGLLSDLILMAGRYKSMKSSVIGYAVFSMWIIGMLMPLWIMRDTFEKMFLSSMGQQYTEQVFALFDKAAWSFPVMAFVSGIIGAFFGSAVLKKHFKKAGIA